MAELKEKGISLERSGLMPFFWILGFVLYIGIIYFLGDGETGSGGVKSALSTCSYTQVSIRLSSKVNDLGINIS